MDTIDTIIKGRWLATCNKAFDVLDRHALAINHGQIIDILPNDKIEDLYHAHTVETLDNHCILPGFINAHTHVGMNYLCGFADDLPLDEWLTKHIWPLEKKWVSEEFVHDNATHAIAEMIRSGITCFNDMYFFPNATINAVDTSGMRAIIGFGLVNFATRWANNVNEAIEDGVMLAEKYHDHPRIDVSIAPHSVYLLTHKELERTHEIALKYKLNVHIHVQETKKELYDLLGKYGKSAVQILYEIGFGECHLQAVHVTHLLEEDFDLLKKMNAHIIHCPESNMKLASGYCPTQAFLKKGINVGLGTDSTASNNNLDMMEEMRFASLLAKLEDMNPVALTANDTLKMATINGAKALGLEKHIGSLEVGKQADFIGIHLNDIETTPCYNPISHIVYAASTEQISEVYVSGKALMKQRKLTTLDEESIIKKALNWQKKLKK
ncbi:MAG: TRZ/ATZ family hydrolase [Gammaproteobacteria bacterium]